MEYLPFFTTALLSPSLLCNEINLFSLLRYLAFTYMHCPFQLYLIGAFPKHFFPVEPGGSSGIIPHLERAGGIAVFQKSSIWLLWGMRSPQLLLTHPVFSPVPPPSDCLPSSPKPDSSPRARGKSPGHCPLRMAGSKSPSGSSPSVTYWL